MGIAHSIFSTILWNDSQDRARAPWRIVLPLVPVLLIAALVATVIVDTVSIPALIFITQLTLALSAFVAFAVSTRYLDRGRSIWDYGVRTDRRWGLNLTAGFVIGILAVVFPSVVGIATGWYGVSTLFATHSMALWAGLGLIFLAYLCTGFWEELVFRGVLMSNAADGLRGWFGRKNVIVVVLVLQAIIFGLVHVDQWMVQAPHPAFVATWILGGLMFGLLYLWSNDLALPIGVHAAINTAEAGLVSQTAPADGGIPVLVLVEPISQSILAGHGGILMISRTLIALLLGVLWLRYVRKGDLVLWTHPAMVVVEQPHEET
ncbi:type II CAAX endopeptidase family protein [Halalkaliarchaeum sp. AArc-CO]|uniref:CPBP family intramembrane glutamic endopeptidase n=1 Tax=Halalkaliarchaeum sp. AArc-CO TaxID=2866381 RepID=UPI00217E3EB2|nr:type II CAAX endopeptidase family protein [Halalkaliarchaeum sp. AArc-CO]